MNKTVKRVLISAAIVFVMALLALACLGCNDTKTKSGLNVKDFDSPGIGSFNTGLEDTFTANVPTKLVVLTNNSGSEACITNLGCRIVSLMVPDVNGNFKDVILGLSSIKDYADLNNSKNVFGACVGPVIGRISNANFTLNGQKYELQKNCVNKHTLHSNNTAWQYQTWNINESISNSVTFQLDCPDMESGFPGNRTAKVKYTLTDDNELKIEYNVSTDKDTPINISNHSYFNLEGDPNNDCNDYLVQIYSDQMGLVDKEVNPTGEIITVPQGSTADFYTKPTTLKRNVDLNDEFFKYANGYDFAYMFNNDMKLKASVYCPRSRINMDVITDRPVINFYDSHDLDKSIVGKKNIAYGPLSGLCFETQAHADAVNQPSFPSIIVKPGQDFNSTTIYKFSVK